MEEKVMDEKTPPLPRGWVWTTLGEVTDINPRDPRLRELPDSKEVTFVPMSAVDATCGKVVQPKVRLLREVRQGYTPFREGDVIFAKITPCMENGKSAIVRNLRNGLGFGSTEFHVLRPKKGAVLPEWVFFYIRQESFREEAKAHFTGTAGQRRVPARFLVEHPLPLPPLPEQRRIVARIEELFSHLDAAEESLRRAWQNLKRYQASVLKAAMEGRLVPTEAELARREGRPFETGAELLERILAERRHRWEEEKWRKLVEKAKKKAAQARRKAQGLPSRLQEIPPEEWQNIPEAEYRRYLPKDDSWKQKYQEPPPPDTSNLPELPEGWAWATVGMVGDLIAGQHILAGDYNEDGVGLPYLTGPSDFGEVFPKVSKWTHKPKAIARKGAVLITVKGAVGKVNLLNIDFACISRQLVALHPSFCPSKFLFYLLQSRFYEFQKRGSGSTIPGIDLKTLQKMIIPLPPLAEQRRIVAEIERRLSMAREVERVVETNLKRIARLRQAILKRAFEGKLVPQDPNDEPAEALLEKIRTERRQAKERQASLFEEGV